MMILFIFIHMHMVPGTILGERLPENGARHHFRGAAAENGARQPFSPFFSLFFIFSQAPRICAPYIYNCLF